MSEQAAIKKKKGAVNADLNFVSSHSLDRIMNAIDHIPDKRVRAAIIPMDEQTALFSMDFVRDGRTTATINGRLRRWAGDMTHIYCDGRAHAPTKWRFWLYRIMIAAIASPFVLGGFMWATGIVTELLSFLYGLSLLAFFFTLMFGGIMLFVTHMLNVALDRDPNRRFASESKPEHKDRERLLDALANIIADTALFDEAANLPDEKPLSDDELQRLIKSTKSRMASTP